MNLRHAAALALVGWYLMAPPPIDQNTIDSDAPVTKWQKVQSFDTASECESLNASMRNDVLSGKGPRVSENMQEGKRMGGLPLSQSAYEKRILSAQCIATDDPRLREK